jgi:carbamoyl-phosphate synthase large subunit
LGADGKEFIDETKLLDKLKTPNDRRIFYIKHALKIGMPVKEVYALTRVDPWFLGNILEIIEEENRIKTQGLKGIEDKDSLYRAKQFGFSDKQLAYITKTSEKEVAARRKEFGLSAVYKLVDTCAAEFEAYTPYYYSTYETEDEVKRSRKKKIMILGGGPNRIGQGIEFDYCCVHASFALREEGFESIMVNSNPETVSTDYDTSDKLYFEPLTREDVLNIIEKEKPNGVIVQFGGQTPLNLALSLKKAGAKIIGTSPEQIDRAEDRKRFAVMLRKLKLNQAPNGTASSPKEAKKIAKKIGYPCLVRPSYVLGGRAMRLVYDEKDLEEFMLTAVEVSSQRPVLIDKFLEDAIEIDVDAVSDGEQTVLCGIMEHIEEAGIHSGDSACALPPFSLSSEIIEVIRQNTYALAKELRVKGLLNIQYAVKNDRLFVLEVNPRASRTIPFVSKATGVAWAKVATKVMVGKSLKEQGITKEIEIKHIAVKEAVFPFNRFPGADAVLGPEMKSTGEVMGIDYDFGVAFMKSQIGAGQNLPEKGKIFVSVNNHDKRAIVYIVKRLVDLGFSIVATKGTGSVLAKNGVDCQIVHKLGDQGNHCCQPNILDLVNQGEISLLINTPGGKQTKVDEAKIRSAAVELGIPLITTISGAQAAANGIEAFKKKGFEVKALQDYFQ